MSEWTISPAEEEDLLQVGGIARAAFIDSESVYARLGVPFHALKAGRPRLQADIGTFPDVPHSQQIYTPDAPPAAKSD